MKQARRAASKIVLAVASGGGHLVELEYLLGRSDKPVVWCTSGATGRPSIPFPYIKAKDVSSCLRHVPRACQILRATRPSQIITTGAAIALPFAVAAMVYGIPVVYVESATRQNRLSTTGRVLRYTRLATIAAQFPLPGAALVANIFDEFEPADVEQEPARTPLRKVVVTLGTSADWVFSAAIDRLVHVLHEISDEETSILWQTGVDGQELLGGVSRSFVPAAELQSAMQEADVVIGHAGVGTAVMALQSGQIPLLLPRRVRRNEHTDDHRVELAAFLTSRSLALGVEVDHLRAAHLSGLRGRHAVQVTPRGE